MITATIESLVCWVNVLGGLALKSLVMVQSAPFQLHL